MRSYEHLDGSELRYVSIVRQLPKRWLPLRDIAKRIGEDADYLSAMLSYAERKGLVEKDNSSDGKLMWRPSMSAKEVSRSEHARKAAIARWQQVKETLLDANPQEG